MAKRVTDKRVDGVSAPVDNKFIKAIILLLGLGVILIGGVDQKCTDEYCEITLKDVQFKEDVFLYPGNWTDVFNSQLDVEELSLDRAWGVGWRSINLVDGCTGSWCGCGWCTVKNPSKFSYAFRAGKTYTLRFKIERNSLLTNQIITLGNKKIQLPQSNSNILKYHEESNIKQGQEFKIRAKGYLSREIHELEEVKRLYCSHEPLRFGEWCSSSIRFNQVKGLGCGTVEDHDENTYNQRVIKIGAKTYWETDAPKGVEVVIC